MVKATTKKLSPCVFLSLPSHRRAIKKAGREVSLCCFGKEEREREN
jgi:hypothetical protein